ncbi:hypothetical protein [Mycobacterium sp. D16R24]|uniref:hypothetical protein n=1 Tax=Mycobacterium sp. D16R24 TaxID=1855656 RepID=UPI0009930DCE|nr:hypothetical protein [Mycobacterium sp. D16R24]
MSLNGALRGIAVGRVASGIVGLAAPQLMARLSRVPVTPELSYVTRIFGARALALGVGYLTCPESERPRWQRLALMVDTIDTTHGVAHVVRGDLPRPAAVFWATFTGGFMALGASKLASDLVS